MLRAGTGNTGFFSVPPNNYPWLSEDEKYKPQINEDGGQLSGWNKFPRSDNTKAASLLLEKPEVEVVCCRSDVDQHRWCWILLYRDVDGVKLLNMRARTQNGTQCTNPRPSKQKSTEKKHIRLAFLTVSSIVLSAFSSFYYFKSRQILTAEESSHVTHPLR
jgi:hypothetical protein